MRYPEFLSPTGRVGLVAPSYGCAGPFGAELDLAEQALSSLGHTLVEGPNCRLSQGLGISSTPASCGQELTEGYCAPDTDVLLSCGGGELMCRDLDHVDFDAIYAAKPKWYMGLSDNTNFTFLLTTLCDVASIYGPCAPSFGMTPWHPAIQDAYDLLRGRKLAVSGYEGFQSQMFLPDAAPGTPYGIDRPTRLVTVPHRDVTCSGRLLGGCLDVLVNLSGTQYDKVPQFLEKYREDGILWFLEACDLNVWSICRGLWQLEHTGWFKYVRGFLIGRPLCHGQVQDGMDQYKAVTEILEHYHVPIVMDADLGHLPPSMPLICGSYATMKVRSGKVTVEMELR
jgi:muramoyltetrapeptide carboxypeptidase LdcA involved in peptidoglycan recycling